MAEIRYVDWDGLIYYDGKIKDYVDDKIRESLKFKGDVTYEELLQTSPSYDNVNTAFRITEEFTTNDWFKNPGYVYSAYTVVFIAQLEDGTFKYDILLEPNGSGNGTDLTNYYTKEDVDGIVAELPTKEFVEKTVIDAIDSIEIDVSGLVAREELELLETKEDAQKKYEDAIAYTDDKFNTLLGDDVEEAYNSFKEIQDLMKADDGVTAALLSDVETVKVTVADAVTHVEQLNDQLDLVDDKVDLVNSLKADKTELPTRVSDLLNDAGYLTEHQDISYLATKDEVAEVREQSASNEVKIMMLDEEIIDINQRIDAIPEVDLTGYATEDYVDEKIAEAALGGEVELDNYYTKEEVDALIPDVSNFATKDEIPTLEGYATEEWVQNQNYLTEHIDISGKADVSELNALGDRVTEVANAVDGKADAAHTHSLNEIVDYEAPDLSNFVTKEEIADFATEQYVADRISEIQIPDVSEFLKEIPEEYVTESELDAKGYLTEHQDLSNYATKDDIANFATEEFVTTSINELNVPEKVSDLINDANFVTAADLEGKADVVHTHTLSDISDFEGYATEDFVLTKIAEAELGGDVDLSNYYTKNEADSTFTTKDELSSLESMIGYAATDPDKTFAEVIDETFAKKEELAQLEEKIGFVEVWESDKSMSDIIGETYATKDDVANAVGEVQNSLNAFENSLGFVGAEDKTVAETLDETYAKKSEVEAVAEELHTLDNRIGFNSMDPDQTMAQMIEDNFATKEELQNAIDNIEHPTVDLTGYATETYVDNKFAEVKVPTKVSELDNDAGYITSADIPETDLSNYYNKSETETLVNEAVSGIEIPEAELYKVDFNAPNFDAAVEAYNNGKFLLLVNAAPDANGYAVMNYVRADLITFTKFLTSRSEFYGSFNTYYLHSDNTWEISKEVKLNKVEANVADEPAAELTSLRIGKEVYSLPSIEGLATETFVTESINNIQPTDLSNYYNKTEVENIVEEAVGTIKVPEVPTNVSAFTNDANYTTLQEVANQGYLKSIPDEYVTADELAAEGFIKEHQSLEEYAKKTDIPSLNGYATEQYVENAISNIDFPDIDTSTLATKEELAAAVSNKANDVLFTADYRVGTPVGQFVADETVQNMTLSQIITKLLGLTLYVPPTSDLPEGTTPTVEEIVVNEVPVHVLGEDGGTVELSYDYKILTPADAKIDDQIDTYFYQVVDPDTGELKESGYHVTTIYQENDYLTVFIPDTVTKFHVEEYSALAGDWSQPNWTLERNDNYTMDGYVAYTVPAEYEVMSGIAVRVIIEN